MRKERKISHTEKFQIIYLDNLLSEWTQLPFFECELHIVTSFQTVHYEKEEKRVTLQ